MPYIILAACNQGLALQGASSAGGNVTLQPVNANNPNQFWDLLVQQNGSLVGVALVQPTTRLAITPNGQGQPVVLQTFAEGQGNNVFSIGNTGTAQTLGSASNVGWLLADSGACAAGDNLILSNGGGSGSSWNLQFVTGD